MEIIKFGKKGCTPCNMVENFLNDEEVTYTSVDVEVDPGKAVEHDVVMTVPVVILKNGDKEVMRTTGFNPGQLGEIIDLYQGAQ
ncbi:glutaredoxin domain-containing protein [Bacillus cereus group sp. TH204-1LC]|uniref:glutaredoxin family protein n=1 Tax=Bacillus cereus group sp. TH204-1LC TaxID=3018054 RepID=UPI0022E3D303|nr:glutaredoxin domain-containing protein [Bacillus cereus group sp. TH204-1LC]MDA1616284.1 glutaredoxin domain-containing protein [Bacillus cereus group sp. TH204-1LC]